ncbi:hypothetical protein LOD99_2601 [Oopsacas minuta]|uniref:Beta-lactamase-related domain-containing protein n=1 Tax=Oopsacas minuta TaxID=111878 RepID=A0AAV7K0J7_9METZ|nr:hypothetical protein LOD99_2601 [Oopsacas minuta]
MRIASISKPLTASGMALLWQRGKIDFDLPIQTYVPEFPVKKFEEKEVTITTRHILTHMSGIRNYIKADEFNKASSKHKIVKIMEEGSEWHNKTHFSDTQSSLEIFKDDSLVHAPSTRYLYSTLAWTLLSAVIETAAKQSYLTFMHNNVFTPYKLYSTHEDKNSPILSHRSKNYVRKSNKLTNTPYVDNSYKWAGGGFLSNVLDISRFANTMLGFYQGVYQLSSERIEEVDSSNEYALSQGIVRKMWACQTETNDKGVCIGLGWFIKPNLEQLRVRSEDESARFSVFHSGGAVGASSYLLILPRGEEGVHEGTKDVPSGIVIAIIGNLENISFSRLISEIGEDLYSVAYE